MDSSSLNKRMNERMYIREEKRRNSNCCGICILNFWLNFLLQSSEVVFLRFHFRSMDFRVIVQKERQNGINEKNILQFQQLKKYRVEINYTQIKWITQFLFKCVVLSILREFFEGKKNFNNICLCWFFVGDNFRMF